MRIISRIIFSMFSFILVETQVLHARLKFSSRDSRIAVSGGSLLFEHVFDVEKGTLEVISGSLLGANIYFNDGQYRLNKKMADVNGTLIAGGVGYVLQGNQQVVADPGMQIEPLLVLGGGNILAGQPDLLGVTTLLNSFSELQIQITNRLNQSILMNNGKITLLNDLTLGDNTTLTGSGRVDLNYKTLRLPAKETTWTSQLYFIQANDVILNAKTSLSGTWTFDGANAVLQGNGNILDLTAGGTLWIKSGADVEFTDIHVRGLGNIYGSIVFEDATSRIRLSNATLQLASDYSVTQGGIYVEGANSSIITGTSTLTLATGASMTVDRVTLFADALDATSTVNVSPNIPDGLTLIYKNNGILKAAGGGDNSLAIANSNAIVGWIKDTSNAVAGLMIDMSNAIAAGGGNALAIDNSNAIIGWIKNTSNVMVSTYNLVIQNSYAIINNSNRITANSQAILSLSQGITNNSSAIVGWIKDTSNAVAGLLVAVSDAVIANNTLLLNTSSAVVAAKQLGVSNSNAIVGWIKNTSNAVAGLLVAVSNAVTTDHILLVNTSNGLITTNQLAVDNSTAILGWVQDTSNAVAGLLVTVSDAVTADNTLLINTSDGLITTNQLAIDNSNAIIGWVQDTSNTVAGLLVAVSDAVTANNTLLLDTSVGVVSAKQLAFHNSTAILGWVQDTSNAVAGLLVSVSDAVVANNILLVNTSDGLIATNQLAVDNSNAIIGWVQETSNAVVGFLVAVSDAVIATNILLLDTSNAVVSAKQLAIDNSTVIIGWVQDTSNAVAGLLIDMSNSIVAAGGNALAVDNSNAIIGWVRDTSNSLASTYNLVVQNSQAIVALSAQTVSNSNAILTFSQTLVDYSNAIIGLSQGVTDNSNAIVGLFQGMIDTSNAIIGVSQGVTDNSNAITGWMLDTSNAMAGLVVDMSNAIVAILDRIMSPTTRYLLEQKPTASVIMDDSLYLDPGDKITIYGDMTIDGSGATVFFCDPFRSQFSLRPGTHVRLKNITFANLNQNSITVPVDSELLIDDNVTLYLSSDMTFSQGLITLDQEASIFTVQGYGGNRKLTFNSRNAIAQPIMMDLGSSSLVLQDIELQGVEFLDKGSTFIDGQVIEGGVVCAGRVQVNMTKSNNMNFLIENIDNIFKMRANNLALRGSISFGGNMLNSLGIQFALLNPVNDPYRFILGDNSLYVSSDVGNAFLLFSDFFVEVFNEGSNAFILDKRSGLFGQNLFISNYPIKLLSTQFFVDQYLQLATDQDNAIDLSFVRESALLQQYVRPQLAYEVRKKKLNR